MNKPLLPCPHCGSKAQIEYLVIRKQWFAVCENDTCRSSSANWSNEKRAIKEWNTRTPPPASMKWPARLTIHDPSYHADIKKQQGLMEGWNACHDAFMKVINNRQSNCEHGMPLGQGCLRCKELNSMKCEHIWCTYLFHRHCHKCGRQESLPDGKELNAVKSEENHCTCNIPHVNHNDVTRIIGSKCVDCNKTITMKSIKKQPSEKKEHTCHTGLKVNCDACKDSENKESDVDQDLINAITNFFPAFQGYVGEHNKTALYRWITSRYVKKEGKDGS